MISIGTGGSGAAATRSRRLLCSVTSRLCEFESLLRHHRQHMMALRKSDCHTLTSILRNPYLLLVVACCVSYWPSIWGQLVFDDRPAIIDNKDLRPNTPFHRLLQNDFWGTPIYKEESHKSYRPLTVLTFRMNFLVHALSPMGYHIMNMALHFLVTLLFYNYSIVLFCDSATSLITALLFAVHPIHCDAVASVVGRAELLSAVFYLTTLLLWNSSKIKMRYKLSFCIISASLGFLCKEQSLTALIVCAINELIARQNMKNENKVISKGNFSSIIAKLSNIRKCQNSFRKKAKTVSILLMAFIFVLLFRMYLMEFKLPKFNRFDNPASNAHTPTRQLTYSYLVAFNSMLLLFPCDLSCDWTHSSIKLISNLNDPRVLITFAFFITLICLLHHALCRSKDEKLIMVLTLAIVPFIPASNLFFPSGFVAAERVLYLPSMGFVLLIGMGINKVLKFWPSHVSFVRTLIAILLVFNGLKTYHRCREWETEHSLYTSGLRVNPENIKLLNNVGRLHEHDGDYDKAVAFFRRAVSIEPEDVRGHLNLGNVFARINRTAEAEEAYRRAVALMEDAAKISDQISPLHLTALLRLSELISRDPQKTQEADQLNERILTFKSDFRPAFESRGRILRYLNRHEEAAVILAKALEYEQSDPDLLYNLGIVVCENGSPHDALQLFDKALSLDPHHEASLLASARIIQDQDLSPLHEVAIERLNTVVEMGRADETVYFNLAMFAVKSGHFEKGKHFLQRAIQIKSNFTEALYNMALLLYNENTPQPLEAIEYLTTLLESNSEHIKGLLLLGDIYIEYFNDLKNGEKCYQRILSIEPSNVFAQHNLCVILVRRKEFIDAIKCFEKIQRYNIASVNVDQHIKITRDLLRDQLRNGSNEFKFLL